MSLTRQVIDAIGEMGRATVDDLVPIFPDRTRNQIKRALNMAHFEKRIRIVVRGESGGRSGGGSPFVYGPLGGAEPIEVDEDMPLPTRTCLRGDYGIPKVASVWELGAV